MAKMKHCPGCGAPNPAGRDVCWSCSHVLLAPGPPPIPALAPQAAPLPPLSSAGSAASYVVTCAACGTSFGAYHPACPRCGLPPQGFGAVRVPEKPPSGWDVEPQADGWVRMEPDRSARIMSRLGGIGLVVLALFMGFSPGRGHTPPMVARPETAWCFVVLLLAAIGGCVWLWTHRESWWVGPDCLEIRHAWLGRQWTETFTEAVLTVRQRWGGRHRYWSLAVMTAGRRRQLRQSGWMGRESLVHLGEYLAALTGWSFESREPGLLGGLFGL